MQTKEAKTAGYALPGEGFYFGKACATPGISDAGNVGYLQFLLGLKFR
ncbi:hypothetical protein LJ707_03115 [Mucilaginibacter sp. UR6-1]|nr:hypothetical protein [Mucilaginibacter sp. UR6-1]